MELLTVGQPCPDEWDLLPGDTFIIAGRPECLFIMAAVYNLRPFEIEAFRSGPITLAAGPHQYGVIIAAHVGEIWADSIVGPFANMDEDYEADVAALWRSWADAAPGEGGTVSAVLVDRDAGDAVAALRMLGTSREFARFVGRQLAAKYDEPLPDQMAVLDAALAWQQANDPAEWAKRRASVTYRTK